ncbi:Uncharacterised protein [Bordetella pertussis]|nr:Uncharacterised protein [Bordetella pertussis]
MHEMVVIGVCVVCWRGGRVGRTVVRRRVADGTIPGTIVLKRVFP